MNAVVLEHHVSGKRTRPPGAIMSAGGVSGARGGGENDGAALSASLKAQDVQASFVVMPPGEGTKSWEGLADLSDRLLALGLDRGDVVNIDLHVLVGRGPLDQVRVLADELDVNHL